MRFIPTAVHGALDYLIGALLIIAPWVLGFADNGAATWTPVVIGAGVIGYSLFTAYEMGAIKLIPMRVHLWLDGIGGAILAGSPWIFGFADYVWVPHLVVGVLEVGAAIFTRVVPEPRPAENAPRGRSDRPAERPADWPTDRRGGRSEAGHATPHGTRR